MFVYQRVQYLCYQILFSHHLPTFLSHQDGQPAIAMMLLPLDRIFLPVVGYVHRPETNVAK